MQTVQTASWIETHTLAEAGDMDVDEEAIPMQFWLRIDPPALAWRDDYGEAWSHRVIDGARHLYTASTWKTCDLDVKKAPITVEELLNHVLFPGASAENDIQADNRANRMVWHHEEVEREGRMLVQWSAEGAQDSYHVMERIWTESDTHRIVGRERREIDPVTNETVSLTTSTNYRYNEPLPEGAFEMPSDKPIIQRKDRDIMPEVWDTLSEKQRQAVQAILHRSEAAWQEGDFNAFSAVWNFHIAKHLPLASEWQERLQQQAMPVRRWQSQVVSANKQEFIPVMVAVSSFRWGPERHKVLRVKSKLSVSWGESEAWTGTTEYYVRRRGRGYRIVHWECPWEEIKEAQQAGRQSP